MWCTVDSPAWFSCGLTLNLVFSVRTVRYHGYGYGRIRCPRFFFGLFIKYLGPYFTVPTSNSIYKVYVLIKLGFHDNHTEKDQSATQALE